MGNGGVMEGQSLANHCLFSGPTVASGNSIGDDADGRVEYTSELTSHRN